jgi:hypothetical protein
MNRAIALQESDSKLTQYRNRLGMETIRDFECLKSWYKLKDFDMRFALKDELFAGSAAETV